MSAAVPAAAVGVAALAVIAAARLSAGASAWRVTRALLARRLLVLASYKFRLAVMAANVVLFLVVVTFVANGFLLPALAPSLEGRGRDVLLYVIVGLGAWPAAWTGYRASADTIRSEQTTGTLETTVGTPAGIDALPFASFVADGIEALFWASLFLSFMFFLVPGGEGLSPAALPVAIAALALASLFLWGIGLVFAALTTYYKEIGNATTVVQYALIVLSGAYVPLDVLPAWLGAAGRAFPLTTAFDLIRASLLERSMGWDAVARLVLLALAALGVVALGTVAFRRGIEAARRAGVIGGY